MINNIKITIGRTEYIITNCRWKKYKDVVKEFKRFVDLCLDDVRNRKKKLKTS